MDIVHIKGFMPREIADIIYEYSINSGNFDEFGNDRKEFSCDVFKGRLFGNDYIFNLVTEYGHKAYNACLDHYGPNFMPFAKDKTHIAKFETGYGMHEHFDAGKPNDIATLIYINDNYEGGQIYFPDLDVEIKPGAGDLIMFPDNPDYVHGVKSIISGVRFTTPRWFTRIV